MQKIDDLSKKLWDYNKLINQTIKKSDCIFVLCSHDLRVAEYAAKLFLENWAPYIIFSGGIAHKNDLLNTGWNKTEAEMFADVVIKIGVPKDKIILEKEATNTGENVLFTKKLLKERGFNFDSFIIVQKPYMERRVFATIKKHFPKMDFTITSPQISFENYPNKEITKEKLINILVGDTQRMKVYGDRGFQIEQEIPEDVWEAYKKLLEAGFNKHLIKE